uniref:DUF4371 domain-containing protein n=1 Tax=Eptatretus burgeri TaxID=7764 RepID=A0A8C4QEF0_EPTBU
VLSTSGGKKKKKNSDRQNPQFALLCHGFNTYTKQMAKRSYKQAFLDVGFTSIVICCPTNPLLATTQATLASYLIAQRIARKMKPHTIGEQLVKLAAMDMARLVCSDDAAKKMQSILLSDNTIHSRIVYLSRDIKDQVVAHMKKAGKWSYQLDESTDVKIDVQLMSLGRYEDEMDLEEEFLFCTPMKTTTTGANIFNVVDNFQQQEGLSWENCVSLCTDGTPAMLGVRQGFTARVKQVNPNVRIFHCLLHRKNPAVQHLSLDLSAVMQEVVAIVNFVKASAVNSRLFEKMCVDFRSEFQHLLFYSSVRWLSRSKVLLRVLELGTELQIFLNEKNHRHVIRFHEKPWMLKVCDLNDVFASVNELNTSMQGRDQNIIMLSDKLSQHRDEFHLQLYAKASLGEFWTAVKKEKPIIASEVMNVLLPFATTYLCEQGFSALTVIKTKACNRLDPGQDMRIALSKMELRIEDIMQTKQQLHLTH